MQAKELKITALFITEDFYSYHGTFKLVHGEKSMDVDLDDLDEAKLKQIKNYFGLSEPTDIIRKEIMSKVVEAAKTESRYVEGKIG